MIQRDRYFLHEMYGNPVLPGHRWQPRRAERRGESPGTVRLPGHVVARRSLGVYELVAQRLGSVR